MTDKYLSYTFCGFVNQGKISTYATEWYAKQCIEEFIKDQKKTFQKHLTIEYKDCTEKDVLMSIVLKLPNEKAHEHTTVTLFKLDN